jgi:hypothetical protein
VRHSIMAGRQRTSNRSSVSSSGAHLQALQITKLTVVAIVGRHVTVRRSGSLSKRPIHVPRVKYKVVGTLAVNLPTLCALLRVMVPILRHCTRRR